ncbi:MAG: YeeE/YedE family protein [Candidatus Omnitrophica bacterium CG11_big_fil_rev_8_21_14_0_20_63_9]|nr:MAG: YeeE/YedE family protein [Candidatus Omnitrophica bacterium CG11_big_fil_rev_8_21_14_0_20_63_9]
MTGFIALISGLLFGVGLAMSEMINRERILGFLDVAGAWDPTLLFVMCGAVGTTLVTFQWLLHRRPFLRQQVSTQEALGINPALIIGSALFGIGWGVSGYCPGPGVALLAVDLPAAIIYLVGVIAGSSLLWTFMSGAKPSGSSNCG